MKLILSKVQIIVIAIFLSILSRIPSGFVFFMNSRGDVFGIANRISFPFVGLALAVLGICIFIGVKRGFYREVKRTFEWKNLLLIFTLVLIALFLVGFIGLSLRESILGTMRNQVTNQMRVDSVLSSLFPFAQIFGASVLAPVFEESIYRASIYQFFGHKWWTFLISSFIFAFVHTGFSWLILFYLPSSLIITYAYHRRQILTDSILAHALFNGLTFFII